MAAMATAGVHELQTLRYASAPLPKTPFVIPYDMRDEVKVLDFGFTGNPLGTPPEFLNTVRAALFQGVLSSRPDPEAYALRTQLSHYHEVNPDGILVGSSSSEMIRLAAQAFQPTMVGISAPCPLEYHLAVTNAGHEVISFQSKHSFATADVSSLKKSVEPFDGAVLANPSYPTSRLLDRQLLIEYLETFQWVIVDESCIELALSGESFVPLTQHYENLIVVRNPSVTFNVPGIPVAYMVAHPHTMKHIRRFNDRSGVGMFAELMAHDIMSTLPWLEASQDLLEKEIPWLQCMLSLVPGVRIYPAEGAFVLCSFERDEESELCVATAKELVDRLQVAGFTVPLMKGIVGLNGEDYFCVSCRKRSENQALISAMRRIVLGRCE